MENQKNIFLEFLKLLRIFSFCLFLWFFSWAHFYKYPMDVTQFQNVLAYMIFLILAFYAQFRLFQIRKFNSEKVKKKAVTAFLEHLHVGYPESEETELAFWEKYIFPYLEGKWKFRWEKIRKCFYCTKEAIAICDSCSPTSSTGLTPEKPLCEDCIVSSIGINIKRFLIPKFEAEKRSAYKKEKVGRLWIYTIPLEIEGIRFSISLSRNQLRKIQKQERGRIHIDFEKECGKNDG